MAYEIDELSEDEITQLKTHPKVRVFLTGIQAMLVALTLWLGSLETAEQLDSQFQIDFEAILNEARQLRQTLMGLKDSIDRLLGHESQMICNQLDPTSDGIKLTAGESQEENLSETDGSITLDHLLAHIKQT